MTGLRASSKRERLRLKAGEVIEVRSREEILASLDADGCLNGMPFMPEMLEFAGKRLNVSKRADKTCDTIESSGLRQLTDTVHLEGTRCSGSAHGGCQAACEIFWNEAWLKRPEEPVQISGRAREKPAATPTSGAPSSGCSQAMLEAATRRPQANGSGEVLYRCQATDLLKASKPLSPWDVRQYVRDVRSGNVGVLPLLKSLGWFLFRFTRERAPGYRLQVRMFNAIQHLRGGTLFQEIVGTLKKTPSRPLGLEPGDMVRVKSVDQIKATLDQTAKNRGLYFDVEMTTACEGTYKVRNRVSRIIEESTGRMINIPGACVILEGVVCTGRYHRYCPRAIFPYWRETWLDRADAETQAYDQAGPGGAGAVRPATIETKQ